MLKIIARVFIILFVSFIMGIGIVYIVNYVIQTSPNTLFDGWTVVFKWSRGLSSLGLIGVIVHVIPFILMTLIVVGIERFYDLLKK